MSDEQFLARWSRRKREAKGSQTEPALEKTADALGLASFDHAAAAVDHAAAEPVSPETELSNLPPIESIDAATDITAFLRKGIPEELSRTALRRAWSADPAIRDFVGLAENAWDFNDPNAMPGFGPLNYSAEQVDALVRRIVREVVETAGNSPNPLAENLEDAVRPDIAEAGFAQSSHRAKVITGPRPFDEPTAAELPNSASGQPVAASEETRIPRRTHGGALPR